MMGNYELVVQGTHNLEDKVSVILALQDKERAYGHILDLHINLERQEGETLDAYEAKAVEKAKLFFRELAEKI
ncbi:DUF1327 domain-containing protein [Cronobacter sp. EKM101R]|nr:DUF1327 domain-containing protein [Cronobacter sp. EKM101R]KAF6599649.1 DUF1327 domain-containing protein [Cronobacter sp. EKM102R]HDI3023529.1 DUF1327 domain-containing protein [Cronobacter turicensis]HDI3035786.1 DUF1327 domain-containing protein [Cronobacter turicensis]